MKNLLSYSYDDLNNSWNHMHSRHEKWLHDIQEQATCLRDEVTVMLNPPSEFLDEHGTLEPMRYVEIVELFEKNYLKTKQLHSVGSLITESFSLVFQLLLARPQTPFKNIGYMFHSRQGSIMESAIWLL